MTQERSRSWKRAVSSKYGHLFLGLVVLFGISSAMTYTSPFDKITENLRRYCYAEYGTKMGHWARHLRELEFYRQKYRERLEALTGGGLGEKKDEAQAFFLNHGLLYDWWEENDHRSYLLARILQEAVYERQFPERVRFDCLVLGEKKIVPFSEYAEGPEARVFVSAGENAIYLHKDSLESVLCWYFEALWDMKPKQPRDFYDDLLRYCLYRDLRNICETAAANRTYMNKGEAQKAFVEDGFRAFLPTLLSMAASMEADREKAFPSDYHYLRACLVGLSLSPNYTMLHLLRTGIVPAFSPTGKKGWKVFSETFGLTDPQRITPEQISVVAHRILKALEGSPDQELLSY